MSRLFAYVYGGTMSKRLDTIAALVKDGVGVIDVGTDHAYIPILLRKNGYNGFITATDINEAPLKKAKLNLADNDCEDSVELRLCDGFADCDPEKADTVIIAGMGGDTIVGILDRAEWCMRPGMKLILQPATKAEILRYWLVNNEFKIENDILIKENGMLNQVIYAEFGVPEKYADAELFTGKYEHIRDSKYFSEHIKRHMRRFGDAADGIDAAERTGLLPWKKLLCGMVSELQRMEAAKNEGKMHI